MRASGATGHRTVPLGASRLIPLFVASSASAERMVPHGAGGEDLLAAGKLASSWAAVVRGLDLRKPNAIEAQPPRLRPPTMETCASHPHTRPTRATATSAAAPHAGWLVLSLVGHEFVFGLSMFNEILILWRMQLAR